MEKRTEFNRSRVEVCRNCNAEGSVTTADGHRQPCEICGGSGLIKKTTIGTVIVEPYKKHPRP